MAVVSSSASTLTGKQALALIGALVNLSTDLGEPDGLHRAITIAPQAEARLTEPAAKTTLHYFVGNAWSELQRLRPTARATVWDWNQPDAENAVFAYRTALNSEGFPALPAQKQAEILTNLANLFDHLGRCVEAISLWDRALQAAPGFGMPRGNHALGLSTYANHLYDRGHKALLLRIAYHELNAALAQPLQGNATAGFTAHRDQIGRRLTLEYLAGTRNLDDYPLGRSKREQNYRKTILAARLFLNPLNDLGPHAIAARDILSTPPLVVRRGEGPYYQGFFNQLKQEFVAARVLYYEGTSTRRRHHADRDVMLTDTLDYPAYGFGAEQVCAAYRLAYSLFDKIAFFLNHYLKLGIPDNEVSFRRIWYTENKQKKGLRQGFLRHENLPLRGLYWLAKDLVPPDDTVTGTLEPDARHLAEIRNHLEHRYFKLHTEGFLGPEPSRATGPLRDKLALSLNQRTFEAKCANLLSLSRAALIYLALAINREETLRAKTRPPQNLRRITLHRIPDRHRRKRSRPARPRADE